ncbi:nucleotidyltransferase domain-containing protein [Hydrogenophaga sp. SL48]|uniref:nucleotidyltransferase domain-containing protein n=1 Tax=Hydrogenophaga sp. SL48 TaxID=2806347 RepID=UPI001F3C094B|nr:nucleotidyltransferase domain-containing protein [Hydrogenophaga sp. SL48]UJW79037.1 nucleotidyltransferase domain-containing protein [Hydrogenophaga sp. SL48]
MKTQFYAFGSLCRGEVDSGSDIDLLACVNKFRPEIDPQKFSIYTHKRIDQLWNEGNPFAWHLHLESRLIYSSDGSDYLADIGIPNPYKNTATDCLKFRSLFSESNYALQKSAKNATFNISCMFLAMRNFATCHSFTHDPIFSRKSPLLIDHPLPVSENIFNIFERARILSTRGYGPTLSEAEILCAKTAASEISTWMDKLLSMRN